MKQERIIVRTADSGDLTFVHEIIQETEISAIARGTGIAKRSAQSIIERIDSGHAIIALTPNGKWAGFAYIQSWDNGTLVSNSGLIVSPAFRRQGVAARIKEQIFQLAQLRYPKVKMFSITSGLAVMKLNSQLGFQAVTYAELPADGAFWDKCESCINYGILQSKQRHNCLCTAMLYNPSVTKANNHQMFFPLLNSASHDVI